MVTRGEFVVLCAAVALRAAVPAVALIRARDAGVFHAPDTGSYVACAESLARGEGFIAGGEPEIRRTPGYPLLLVPGVLAGHVSAVTIPLQVALGTLTVWLVYRLTGVLTGSPRAAFIAGLLCAVEPLSAVYCSILLSETLFAAVLLAGVFLLAVYLSGGEMRFLLLAAIALAASAYVRPIAYLLPGLLAGCLLLGTWRDGGKRAALRACAFLALCAALTGAWRVRNFVQTGYTGFSTISDLALYFYQGAAVRAAVTGTPYYEVQRRMGCSDPASPMARHPEQENLIPAQRSMRRGREGARIVMDHPRVFAAIYAKGIVRTLCDPGAIDCLKLFGAYREGSGLLGEAVDRGLAKTVADLARRRPFLFRLHCLLGAVLALYLAAAVAGLIVCRGRGAAVVALTACYLVLLSGGANALGRFRHPVMPLVCVFAGCGLDAALRPAARGRARGTLHRGRAGGPRE